MAPRTQRIDRTFHSNGVFDASPFSSADGAFDARAGRAYESEELWECTIDHVGSTDATSSRDEALAVRSS